MAVGGNGPYPLAAAARVGDQPTPDFVGITCWWIPSVAGPVNLRCLRMDEIQRLSSPATINAEIAQVRGDYMRPGKTLSQRQDAGVGHIHGRPIFRHGCPDFRGIRGQDRLEADPPVRRQGQDQVNGPTGTAQEITRLGEHDLATHGSFTETIQDSFGPGVMGIRSVGEGHQRTGIQDVTWISHAQNLPGGKGPLGP